MHKIIGCKSESERTDALHKLYLVSFAEHEYVSKNRNLIIHSEKYNDAWFQSVKKRVTEMALNFGASKDIKHLNIRYYLVGKGIVNEIDSNFRGAICNSLYLSIIQDLSDSEISMELTLAHELFHLYGFKSSIFKNGDLIKYRGGITFYDSTSKVHYFNRMEEALMAMLSKKYFEKYILPDPNYKTQIEIVQTLKFVIAELLKAENLNLKFLSQEIKDLDNFFHFKNLDQWEKLKSIFESDLKLTYKESLMDSIFGKDGEIFHDYVLERKSERIQFQKFMHNVTKSAKISYDTLFDTIAYAHFNGSYLKMARIIKKAFGHGAFRLTAEAFAKR